MLEWMDVFKLIVLAFSVSIALDNFTFKIKIIHEQKEDKQCLKKVK